MDALEGTKPWNQGSPSATVHGVLSAAPPGDFYGVNGVVVTDFRRFRVARKRSENCHVVRPGVTF